MRATRLAAFVGVAAALLFGGCAQTAPPRAGSQNDMAVADPQSQPAATLALAERLIATSRSPGDADALAATRLLDDAQPLVDAGTDERARSAALGLRGLLAARTVDPAAALPLLRRAAFLAQYAPQLQYRWQWEIGRVLLRTGDTDGAERAYRLATETLLSLRAADTAAPGQPSTAALHFEYADLLLRRTANLADDRVRAPLLLEARRSIESLKAAELRDYFRDDCVTELRSRITPIDRLPGGNAALYPILLADRIELLLSLPERLVQVTVPVPREVVDATVRRLRGALEKRTTREYLPLAQQVYRWLIAPLEPALASASIDTLAIVPDGLLRTIPMSVLHDGRQFLVQRYALASTPGLDLTDARPLPAGELRVLLGGVSQPVQGFGALERVPDELAAVAQSVGGTPLLDDRFVESRLSGLLEREPWQIVHLASHAQFDADPERTFLLTFDGKLGIARLGELIGASRFRTTPIELLTLSACQTAAGDERAALGLAGVAVQSGARSALAGLWFVDDVAASSLIAAFYRQLGNPQRPSKAKALQQAQVAMLQDRRYAHPGYWAPFLLIGNWQ